LIDLKPDSESEGRIAPIAGRRNASDDVHPWKAVANGLRTRCPHCGEGPLIEGWSTLRRVCPACGLVYERNPGDTWAFWIIGNRVPLFAAIAAVYLGIGPQSWLQGLVIIAAFAAALVVTLPQRLGLVTALDYLSRRYWPDPADAIPPLPKRPH
jgi:uncharacterized protein (DUF983 family)